MCRLFVFAKADNDHPDPDLDWTKFKRGDVVEVLEDGQHGGSSVEGDPLFHIIEVPGVPAAALHALKRGDSHDPSSRFHPRRTVNRLDLDALIAGHGNASLTRDQVLGHRKVRPQVRKR